MAIYIKKQNWKRHLWKPNVTTTYCEEYKEHTNYKYKKTTLLESANEENSTRLTYRWTFV